MALALGRPVGIRPRPPIRQHVTRAAEWEHSTSCRAALSASMLPVRHTSVERSHPLLPVNTPFYEPHRQDVHKSPHKFARRKPQGAWAEYKCPAAIATRAISGANGFRVQGAEKAGKLCGCRGSEGETSPHGWQPAEVPEQTLLAPRRPTLARATCEPDARADGGVASGEVGAVRRKEFKHVLAQFDDAMVGRTSQSVRRSEGF